jgi:hypothetical protein
VCGKDNKDWLLVIKDRILAKKILAVKDHPNIKEKK